MRAARKNAFWKGFLNGLYSISYIFSKDSDDALDRAWKGRPIHVKKTRVGSFEDDKRNIRKDFDKAIAQVIAEQR